MNIALLSPADATPWLADFADVYRAAFSGPPYHRQERDALNFGRALPAHLARPGFLAAAVFAEQGEVVGFAYGYRSLPGQWWRDHVAAALGPDLTRQWLTDAFQLTELAVVPTRQGCGLGAGLHDTLLAAAIQERAALSTLDAPTRAYAMYLRRGWQPLLGGFRFPGVERPYAILGRTLPLNGATSEKPPR